MHTYRVLVIRGYGFFGRRLVERLGASQACTLSWPAGRRDRVKRHQGDISLVGARPCIGLEDFARESEGLRIAMAEVAA